MVINGQPSELFLMPMGKVLVQAENETALKEFMERFVNDRVENLKGKQP